MPGRLVGSVVPTSRRLCGDAGLWRVTLAQVLTSGFPRLLSGHCPLSCHDPPCQMLFVGLCPLLCQEKTESPSQDPCEPSASSFKIMTIYGEMDFIQYFSNSVR